MGDRGSVSSSGKVNVAGGSDGVTQLNTLYIYNIASNTWTTGVNVPVAVEWAGSAVLRNDLYLFGGVPPLVTTQIYNPGAIPGALGRIWAFTGFAFTAQQWAITASLLLAGRTPLTARSTPPRS